MRSGSKILVSCLLVLSAGAANARGDDRLAEASKRAEAGDWAAARGLYAETLRETARPSAAFFYNFGTASLRAGAPGPAAVLLEKSVRLNPLDGDARSNLRLARGKLNPLVLGVQPSGWISWWPDFLRTIPTALWWILGFACLAPGLWLSVNRRELSLRWGLLGAAALLLLGGALAAFDARYETGGLIEVAKLLSGPGPTFPELGNLDAGARVTVEEERAGWRKVRYLAPGGREVVGWVPAAALIYL